MAIQVAAARTTTGRAARQRPMRTTRLVSLRSTMPTGLMTLRHDVPEYLSQPLPAKAPASDSTDVQKDNAPKVEKGRDAVRAVQTRVRIETAARKGN